jgi:dipeptidyl aminopeptidase/acylaminoacyl peptidase
MKQRKNFVILDKTIEPDFIELQRYADGDISVVSRDHNDAHWIVAYVHDNTPIMYVYYDRASKHIEPLFFNKPALHNYTLASTQSVRIPARDGLVLEGYCTKPLTWKQGQKLPLIVMVHGGPWSRDTWGYDMEAQWLANRGYSCLRVNYRGSTGYGKSFLQLGMRQWGGTMLNDIVDAAQWAIKEGFADSEKIAVMGFSYGGYTALCATTMTEMFACGVSGMGPSNLVTFLTSLPAYFEPAKNLLYTMIGDPATDAYFLRTRSPLFHINHLRVPLLIAQGLNDPRVKKNESDQIINELVARNLAHDYVLFTDEGHGLVHERNRLIFYARAERFFADVLHGLCEA